jgi:hypothetical protein
LAGSIGVNNKDMLIPFWLNRRPEHDSPLIVNEDLFKETVDVGSLWCPLEECSHEKWVTNLVCTVLKTFTQEGSFVSHLVPVCSVKVNIIQRCTITMR